MDRVVESHVFVSIGSPKPVAQQGHNFQDDVRRSQRVGDGNAARLQLHDQLLADLIGCVLFSSKLRRCEHGDQK